MTDIKEVLCLLKEIGVKRIVPYSIPSQESILEAESKLNIKFPESYKYFIQESTKYTLNFEEFLWLRGERDFLANNLEEKSLDGGIALPWFLVSFLIDGYGTQICFDTRYIDTNGEYPIAEWERHMMEEHLSEREPAVIADNFSAWLRKTLENEKEELLNMDNDT